MTQFHNPYNFVPLGRKLEGLLGQEKPKGHDRYHRDLWSGRIEIEIETVTPLLIRDAARAEEHEDDAEHKTFGVRRGPDGRPLLPATSLKGALRSAFEVVTNSRFSVFEKHEKPPARRMAAGDGLAMVPARISDDGYNLEMLLGSHDGLTWGGARPTWNNDLGRWILPNDTLYAAWLPQYQKGTGGYDHTHGVQLNGGGWPKHAQAVSCWIELWAKGPFKYWRVRSIAAIGLSSNLRKPPASTQGYGQHRPVGGVAARLIQVNGWVVKTNQNFGKKHDERVFFSSSGSASHQVPLVTDWRDRYIDLVRDYHRTHKSDLEQRKRRKEPFDKFYGNEPGRTAWSRHVCNPDEARLNPGDLVYARIDRAGNIEGLYPVMISRELGQAAPERLLPHELHPATKSRELSPADRVFGWVNQQGAGAYKGQLRIHSVKCGTAAEEAVDKFDPALPLAILGAPKEAQARFYVGKPDGRAMPTNTNTAGGAYFEKGKDAHEKWNLRGRKVYPHHAATLSAKAKAAGYWDPEKAVEEAHYEPTISDEHIVDLEAPGAAYREYIRRRGLKRDKNGQLSETGNQDSQNRSITEWVRPGTKFTAAIDVVNLNIVELGVLLWLLDPPVKPRAFHRLGGGKPLGFGSARISITHVSLKTGAAKAADYRAFFGQPDYSGIEAPLTGGPTVAGAFIAKAEAAWGSAFVSLPNAQAFLQAARGYRDGLPTHYPRRDHYPNPAGENYKWFGENESGRKEEPRRRKGLRLSLPAITDDEGLPLDPTQ
ncbi:protein of unknown function DUF324 [Rhodomicrobium vannielii ATCC 17100]|uniref:CRISPR type III-associated protein domain-containing protein n=1 Tax=Rhodomicrobium vannielii (strain ATCC 17100 / DSM 162 / LMG 4299 / NCIMB 10020 / ATH 3.1.1) TaxID=648757 RepID=E3I080_RHOVT|nr:TIGR03986 family CRISPR-associated RAMP protein [Rhodomicrobium vannielii]ADP71115.1 protein of unknown function DUF324 [Rhodomicrobium vannielii ATCC 17100]